MPFAKMSDVTPSLRGIKPPISLSMANTIARIADRLEGEEGVDNPWAVAINTFKKMFTVKDGKWVRKKKDDTAEFAYPDLKRCPKCGEIIASAHKVCPMCGHNFGGKELRFTSNVKAIEVDGKRFIVLWTSNAFEDREKEIFETKAWQEYVTRRDLSGRRDRVWFWHVKGTDFATVVWQAVVGRMLVEVAEVDNTKFANKMFHALQHPEEFKDTLPEGWGTSHGYLYRASDKKEGVYAFVEKFESTVLPAHKASNIFGKVKEVLEMTVTAAKSNALANLVGEELAETMLTEALKATEALENAGVAHKEEDVEEEGEKGGGSSKKKNPFMKVDGEEEEDEEDEEEDEKSTDDDDNLYELELDEPLLKEIAKHAAEFIELPGTKEIEELLEGFKEEILKVVAQVIPQLIVGAKEQVVQEALSGRLVLKPYEASKDNGNVTTEDELPDVESEEKARKKDPVKAVVRNVMGVGS